MRQAHPSPNPALYTINGANWSKRYPLVVEARAVQVRAIKGVAENPKSEGTRRYSRPRWIILIAKRKIIS
jgi:hypothetical protein